MVVVFGDITYYTNRPHCHLCHRYVGLRVQLSSLYLNTINYKFKYEKFSEMMIGRIEIQISMIKNLSPNVITKPNSMEKKVNKIITIAGL